MKCISKINKLNKIAKKERLLQNIAENRRLRLIRKEQAKIKKLLFVNGKKAETVILDKLKKVLPENHKINDNNNISRFSRMDFTYYIENNPITDIEHKYRIGYKHNQFQEDEFTFGTGRNTDIGQKKTPMVYVKSKYLLQLI